MIVELRGPLTYPSISIDLSSAGLNVHAPPSEVIFDFLQVGFVEPSGVVMLHNLGNYLVLQGCSVYYRNHNAPRPGLHYLDGTGFFQSVLGSKAFAFTALRSTTLSLREVRTIDAYGWVNNELLPWFAGCASRDMRALSHFGSCVSELFNNIRDHSAYEVGSIFAQWYPNIDTLKMAIGDFGRGIPANVATVEPNVDGAAAIVRAFDEGFSSLSTPKNRGAGLYFLVQNVCRHLGGSMRVFSGGAAVAAVPGGHLHHMSPIIGNSGYTGTLFEIELPTRQIMQSNTSEEDFTW